MAKLIAELFIGVTNFFVAVASIVVVVAIIGMVANGQALIALQISWYLIPGFIFGAYCIFGLFGILGGIYVQHRELNENLVALRVQNKQLSENNTERNIPTFSARG